MYALKLIICYGAMNIAPPPIEVSVTSDDMIQISSPTYPHGIIVLYEITITESFVNNRAIIHRVTELIIFPIEMLLIAPGTYLLKVCMQVHIHVCKYIYMYAHTHTHTHTYICTLLRDRSE